MTISRRAFLTTGATLVAAAAAPSRLLAAVAAHTPPPRTPSNWADVRAMFSVTRDQMHFSSFYFVSHPAPVREAIDAFRKAIDADPYLMLETRLFVPEGSLQVAVCEEAARYMGGKADEIAITGNTTTGLALVYHGLKLAPGDEVLTTAHDHYSHHESIRLAAERSGTTWRKVALYDRGADANADEIARRVTAAIRPETRALGITWVHSSTGVRLPIRRIADAVAEVNRSRDADHRVLLIVDGVHGIGAVDEDAARMGADFFCAGTHKWLFAPRGTGLVWGRAEAWSRLRPTIPTFSSFETFDGWMHGKVGLQPMRAAELSPGGFQAYEHQWAMAAAFQLHGRIGRAKIAARIRALNTRLKDGLAAMPKLTLHTPRDPELSAGITCFEVEGVAPEKVVELLLKRRIVASTSPYIPTYARLAPSLLNDEAEVDAALAAVRAIAAT